MKKVLSHLLHWYGLSPKWVLIWFKICSFVAKPLSPSLHLYGFSPVWVFMWLVLLLLLFEIHPTVAAFIWFFSSVDPHMNCKMGFWWENCATLITSMSTMPTVTHHMTNKLTILGEFLVLFTTCTRFLSSVGHHMAIKNTLSWENSCYKNMHRCGFSPSVSSYGL